LAVVGLTVLAACDLVFAPGKLSVDADTSHPDADPHQPDADPLQPDADPHQPDAPFPADAPVDADHGLADANICAVECLGDHGINGIAPCAIPQDWCSTSELDTLDPIDLCSCSVGVPSLYVFDVDLSGGTMSVAFLPASNDVTYYLSVDGMGCLGPDVACAIDNVCGTPGSILAYRGAVPTGGPQTFRLWTDDACSLDQVALFEWFP